MRILVTGANGYLGSGVVKKLLDDGIEVCATDIDDIYIDKRAQIYKADLFSIKDPYRYFDKPEVILHMAWKDGFIHNSDKHISELPKHKEFIEKMITSGISRIAVMGSMHEIGFYEGCVSDDTACNPQSMYGIAKNALRQITYLLCKQNNVDFQWLRGYYIVGNTTVGSSIFSKITAAEKDGQKTFPFTWGQNQFDFIDYDLFCVQVAKTIEQSEIKEIINICSGKPEKLCDRVERFIKENNYNIKLEYGAFPDRPYDSKAIWGSDKKINSIMKLFK